METFESHFTDGNTRWTEFMQVQGLEKGFIEKTSLQTDEIDDKQLQLWESQMK